jgi:serpin B
MYDMKNSVYLWLLVLALVASTLAGCASSASASELRSDKPRIQPAPGAEVPAELVSGNNAFAFDLYQELRSQDGNLFYSPFSISTALAMTYAGARGETEQQMASALHYILRQEELHAAFNLLDRLLQSPADSESAFRLNIANALWGQQDFEFLNEFLDVLAQNYGAGIRLVDFAQDEAARQTINQWVSDATQEKIKDLIPSGVLAPNTRLVLANAIYFYGKWVWPFDPDATHDAPFTMLDGGSANVSMMAQDSSFDYVQGDGYQAISLPYQDSEMSMIFVLPELDRFDEIEAAFTPEMLDAIVSGFRSKEVRLFLPKFTFESTLSGLTDSLGALGMVDAFDPDRADFSGMDGRRDLFISDVLHKAFVAVDEEGTEAAAATAVIIEVSSAQVDEPEVMRLDHPFLFLIRDNHTGSVLFMGRVVNPSA